ncbi:MAG: hypothetical protein KA248_04310 [Kiritimatiellae bacterium]|nr:hypothetical protein [Kiritimatiellia bacterium]
MAPVIVKEGLCHALYVFDIGLSIDLERVRRLLARSDVKTEVTTSRRAPKYYGGYQPAPLHVGQQAEGLTVAGRALSPAVDMVLYDFGAVTVAYAIPFEGPLAEAGRLSCELNAGAALERDARRRVEDLLLRIRGAVSRPRPPDPVEDYLMFEVRDAERPGPLDQLPAQHGEEIARILRAETGPLSAQEVADAVSVQLSYGPDDLTLIDWNAALIFDRDAGDVLDVLEFANIELLELRVLDAQLDDSLDRSYELLSRFTWQRLLGLSRMSSLRRVGQMQVDGAILFERVSNALKLLGDQYLARVYRLASQRFHLAEWNTGNLRKLDTIESLYEKLSDRNANRRLEILEWIIILLIAFEIVWPFVSRRWGL